VEVGQDGGTGTTAEQPSGDGGAEGWTEEALFARVRSLGLASPDAV
jgi:hypothetical protein